MMLLRTPMIALAPGSGGGGGSGGGASGTPVGRSGFQPRLQTLAELPSEESDHAEANADMASAAGTGTGGGHWPLANRFSTDGGTSPARRRFSASGEGLPGLSRVNSGPAYTLSYTVPDLGGNAAAAQPPSPFKPSARGLDSPLNFSPLDLGDLSLAGAAAVASTLTSSHRVSAGTSRRSNSTGIGSSRSSAGGVGDEYVSTGPGAEGRDLSDAALDAMLSGLDTIDDAIENDFLGDLPDLGPLSAGLVPTGKGYPMSAAPHHDDPHASGRIPGASDRGASADTSLMLDNALGMNEPQWALGHLESMGGMREADDDLLGMNMGMSMAGDLGLDGGGVAADPLDPLMRQVLSMSELSLMEDGTTASGPGDGA